MTGKSLKHHYALIPLFVIMAVGMAFVTAFIGRLAIYSPDTNWTRYIYYQLQVLFRISRLFPACRPACILEAVGGLTLKLIQPKITHKNFNVTRHKLKMVVEYTYMQWFFLDFEPLTQTDFLV